MSRVFIVSKTRMHEGRVCVGGVDIDNHRSLRLMDSDGRHEYVEDCPYEIYDIWDLCYIMSSYRPAPHAAEDCNVTWRKRLGNTGYVDNLPAILKGCGMKSMPDR